MKIRKRNGDLQEFKFEKVINAIKKASVGVSQNGSDDLSEVLDEIQASIHSIVNNDIIEPGDLQDLIEEKLLDFDYREAAKSFIRYRYKQQLERENKIAEKLSATNVQNQNANVDELSFGGKVGEATRVITKDFALKHNISKMARDNHNNNMIYIHDLDSYVLGEHNCLTLPIDDLWKNGAIIKGREIRPAGSVGSACQLLAVYFQTQSLEQFGGVAVSCLDWSLVPYVRKSFWKLFDTHLERLTGDVSQSNREKPIILEPDDTATEEWNTAAKWALIDTKRELHQGIEALYHNLNTLLSRSGN